MALLGSASFDVYGTADVTADAQSVGLGSIVAGAGRCNSAAWHGTAAVGSGPTFGVSPSTLSGYCGFAYKLDSFSTIQTWSTNKPDSTPLAFLRVLNNGALEGWKGFNTILGTVVCTSPAGLVHAGRYSHIGIEWLISTTGYLRLYHNGHLVADSGTVNMHTGFSSGQWGLVAFTPTGYIDDCYWGDTATSDPLNPWGSFLGDLRVEGQNCLTDAVGGGGTFREFTPSAGVDHGALLDDNPLDNGTTYVESQTIGHRETVKFANITPSSGAVYGIRVMPALLKTTFADRLVAPTVLSGGTLTAGADQAPAQTDYAYYGQMFGGNPTTGVAWTIATTNAMEAGLNVTG